MDHAYFFLPPEPGFWWQVELAYPILFLSISLINEPLLERFVKFFSITHRVTTSKYRHDYENQILNSILATSKSFMHITPGLKDFENICANVCYKLS